MTTIRSWLVFSTGWMESQLRINISNRTKEILAHAEVCH
jgi:hypothetical protein